MYLKARSKKYIIDARDIIESLDVAAVNSPISMPSVVTIGLPEHPAPGPVEIVR